MLKQDLQSLEYRPAVADDDARIFMIHNLHERSALPLTVERLQSEYAGKHGEDRSGRYVATLEGNVVGYANFRRAWWTGQPTIYAVDLRVDPLYLHRGIGTGLFAWMHSQLLLRGATRLLAWIDAEGTQVQRFATRSGFRETGQVVQEYYLTVADADTHCVAELEALLQTEGLRILSLSELGRTGLLFLRSLQRLWAEAGDETADSDQFHSSFETWQRQVLQAPGLSPETHWVALEGEHPIGMTFLNRLSDDAFENDYTAVASTHRGQGVATALKLHAIAWAQQQEVRAFYTSSEIGNTAMIAVNKRLGYRPGVLRKEVACDLS